MENIDKHLFAVIDLETTGLTAGKDKIIEIAVVRVNYNYIVGEFSTLINPKIPIPPEATAVNGITNEDVANAPTIEEVMPRVYKMVEGLPIVGHNIFFDMNFLRLESMRIYGRDIFSDNPLIDTVKLAKKMFPSLENYKLETIKKYLKMDNFFKSHRALDDVKVTAAIYAKYLSRNGNLFRTL